MLTKILFSVILTLAAAGSCSAQNASEPAALVRTIRKAHSLLGLPEAALNLTSLRTNALSDPEYPGLLSYHDDKADVVFALANEQIKFCLNRQRVKPFGNANSDTNRPARMSKAAADARVLKVIADLEIPNWREYRHWAGKYILPNNFEPRRREWGYVWHRHIGDIPVADEMVIIHVDDETGDVISLSNFSSRLPTPSAKKPRLSPDDAAAIASKEWPVRLRKEEKNLKNISVEIKFTHLFYRHLDTRHDDFGNLVNANAVRRLRLLYGLGVMYNVGQTNGEGYRASATLLVDAETGEMWRDRPER